MDPLALRYEYGPVYKSEDDAGSGQWKVWRSTLEGQVIVSASGRIQQDTNSRSELFPLLMRSPGSVGFVLFGRNRDEWSETAAVTISEASLIGPPNTQCTLTSNYRLKSVTSDEIIIDQRLKLSADKPEEGKSRTLDAAGTIVISRLDRIVKTVVLQGAARLDGRSNDPGVFVSYETDLKTQPARPKNDASWTMNSDPGKTNDQGNSVVASFPDLRHAVDVAFSPDGRRVFAAFLDEIYVAQFHGRKVVTRFSRLREDYGRSRRVVVSPDGSYLLLGDDKGKIESWTIDPQGQLKLASTFVGHPEPVTSMAISQDGKYVLSGDLKGGLTLWNHEIQAATMNVRMSSRVCDTGFSPDRKKAVAISGTRFCEITMDTADVLLSEFEFDRRYRSDGRQPDMALSPEGDMVAARVGRDMYMLNPNHGFQITSEREMKSSKGDYVLLPDGKHLLQATDQLEIWFVRGPRPFKVMSMDTINRTSVKKLVINDSGNLVALVTDRDLMIIKCDIGAFEQAVSRTESDTPSRKQSD